MLISSDFASPVFENGRRDTLSYFDRDDAKRLESELTGGEIDLALGQLIVTLIVNRSVKRESMIDRIRNSD